MATTLLQLHPLDVNPSIKTLEALQKQADAYAKLGNFTLMV